MNMIQANGSTPDDGNSVPSALAAPTTLKGAIWLAWYAPAGGLHPTEDGGDVLYHAIEQELLANVDDLSAPVTEDAKDEVINSIDALINDLNRVRKAVEAM